MRCERKGRKFLVQEKLALLSAGEKMRRKTRKCFERNCPARFT
jgi:hypothetical protein